MVVECHESISYERLKQKFGDIFNDEYKFRIIEVDGKRYLCAGAKEFGFCDGYYTKEGLLHIVKEDVVEVKDDVGDSILKMIEEIKQVDKEYGLNSYEGMKRRRRWEVERSFYDNPVMKDILLKSIEQDEINKINKEKREEEIRKQIKELNIELYGENYSDEYSY